MAHGRQAVIFAAAYAPVAAWGPLLGIVTVLYYRRRRQGAGSGHIVAIPGGRDREARITG